MYYKFDFDDALVSAGVAVSLWLWLADMVLWWGEKFFEQEDSVLWPLMMFESFDEDPGNVLQLEMIPGIENCKGKNFNHDALLQWSALEELEICVCVQRSMGEAPRWAKKNYFSEKIDVKPLKDSR